jgi:nicotinamidase-related amidase
MATRTGSNSALLVIDVQVGVVTAAWERDRIIRNIALAVARAREGCVPVFWVQHDDADLKRDTPEWQWVPELQANPDEPRIYKHYNSAFEDTNLLQLLEELQVSHVFIAGAATNWCIRATAYGALDRGFDLTLLEDAHMTRNMELAPGRVVEARSMIDDLNVVMRWLAYPGRANSVVAVAAADFSRHHAASQRR